jgi:alanyl-tRNA synthetase
MAVRTKLLYYKEPYTTDFTATVLSVDKVTDKEKKWDVILDRTCFYPEGGGQPSDIGEIDEIEVESVFKRNGEIYHRMTAQPEEKEVQCRIDWSHRYDYMQQHTGQHIISGALHASGYETVSVHQGENLTTIEIDKPDISGEDLKLIENLSNKIISRNIEVSSEWVNDDRIKELSLRRKPKVSGQIRIIRIDDFDQVACGGIHTRITGEIECIKYISVEKIRGHARIGWKIGKRVFQDYEEKISILSRLSTLFSARQHEILPKIEELINNFQEEKKLYSRLENRFSKYQVKDMFQDAPKIGDISFITSIFENESKDFLKNMVNIINNNDKYLICLINKRESDFQWILAAGGVDFPFAGMRQELLRLINARGGGKPPVWQGVADNTDGIDLFFDTLRSELMKI